MIALCGRIRSILRKGGGEGVSSCPHQKTGDEIDLYIRSSLCVVEALAEHLSGAQHGHEGVQMLLVE